MVSLFIDDELTLDLKHDFVENIHNDQEFYLETIDFIDQEKLLRGDVVDRVPDTGYVEQSFKNRFFRSVMRPLAYGLAGAATMVLVVWMSWVNHAQIPAHMNRFVIYRPDVTKVEIAGSFTGWERIPLTSLGQSGYWEVTLEVPTGVHRYTYILEGETPFADPTILAVESDDFGGINSILTTES